MTPKEVKENFERFMSYHGFKWADKPRLQIRPEWEELAKSALMRMYKEGWDGTLHGIGMKLGGMRIYTGKSHHKVDHITRKAFEASLGLGAF
jgi:hypothetical protein